MSWYQIPVVAAILGGLAGAFISGLVSVYIWRRSVKIKRVDCIINDVSSLLSVSEKIKDQLAVSFSGNPVNAVYLISIDLICTGNIAVTNQPINIRLAQGSRVIDYSKKTHPPVGFGNIEEIKKESNCLDLVIELMNPGDRLSLEIVSIDNVTDDITVFMKNANVQTRIFSKNVSIDVMEGIMSDKNLMALAMLSAVPFFGGLARSIINVAVAQRISKLGERK